MRRWLPLLACLAAVAGCTGHPTTTVSSAQAGSTSTPSVTVPSPTPTATPTRPITINFAGDVHFAEHVAALADDPQAFAGIAPALGDADLTVLNLETAITTRGTPEAKAYRFRIGSQALIPLKNAGVDVVSMANNHAADYGVVGLQDTLAAKATSPLPMIGIGATEEEAFTPYVATVNGVSIAIIAADEIWDETTLARYSAGVAKPGVANGFDRTRLVQAVKEARAAHDVVVVYEHWGVEEQNCPSPRQRETATLLAQAGADAIIGSHAHVPQGAGWQGSTFVGFGLGDFVWWRTGIPGSRAGILQITLDPVAAKAHQGNVVSSYRWRPTHVQPSGAPMLVDDPLDKKEWAAALACSGLAQC